MCGISGIISVEKTKFNINHFNILGTLNDERGGDSCGIFIDGIAKYGIKEDATFRNFLHTLTYPQEASIALLHCRKASFGYPINIEQAQPIIIKENNEVKFVLMHNGTINNIKNLATKYIPTVNTIGLSDSQMLAKIIYNFGYDVLEEYEGSAVLIMVDYRFELPKIFIFKGSSIYNEQGLTSERPLYYMIYDNKFYFSSMYSSLYCIDYTNTIFDFPVNKLCEVRNNNLYCIKKVDRSKIQKPKIVPFNKSNVIYYRDNLDFNDYGDSYLIYNTHTHLYYKDAQLAHGAYDVYPSGLIVQNSNYNCLWFFRGRLLYNQKCYDFLNQMIELYEDNLIINEYPEIIDYFAYNYIIKDGKEVDVNENFEYIPCDNVEYYILFERYSAQIIKKNGHRTDKYVSPIFALAQFRKAAKNVKFDFKTLAEDVISHITKKTKLQNDCV